MAEQKKKESKPRSRKRSKKQAPPEPENIPFLSNPDPEPEPIAYLPESKPEHPNQAYSVVLFALAILVLLLAIVQGENGWHDLHIAIKGFFGPSVLLIPPALCYIAIMIDREATRQKVTQRAVGALIIITFLSGFVEIMFGGGRLMELGFRESLEVLFQEGTTWSGGGMIAIVAYPFQAIFGDIGSKILICLSLFVSFMLVTKKSLGDLYRIIARPFEAIRRFFREDREEGEIIREYDEEADAVREYAEHAAEMDEPKRAYDPAPGGFLMDIPVHDDVPAFDRAMDPMDELGGVTASQDMPRDNDDNNDDDDAAPSATDARLEEMIRQATGGKGKKKNKDEEKLETMLQIADEVAQQGSGGDTGGRPYMMPRLDFLDRGESHANDPGAADELREKHHLLEQVLESFNVDANITNIARGPSVTRYEVQPAAGVKVSRITSLANDIALNFAVEGVRMEAPIPGKPAIGIEVPNAHRDTVSLRELLETRQFREAKSKLVFGVGKDIAGNVIIGDIAKMPHMIIAGATGSGKSVCTNSIIMSILYHATPEEVRLILIDPKIVEFRVYDGIPHLLIPVVTDPKKAAGALGWAVQEMLGRYDTFAHHGVRNLEEFNRLAKHDPELKRMPQILICIDELAELMMTASKEVEDAICRLAQLARAAGMHLIIATQRPTTNIITGLIKANIPSRIALSVKSQIDSRVILDCGGAETLLGNGDMLYLPSGQPKPLRVQGCYVSTKEIERVVNYIKTQGETDYDEEIIHAVDQLTVTTQDDKAAEAAEVELDEDADLLEQAIDVVVAAGQASTSNLQRRLRLGYGRAARIMDELEKMGIIGPYEGAKPRRVLLTKAQLDERKLKKMK